MLDRNREDIDVTDSDKPLRGNCLCGKVTISISGEPHMSANCHCLSCQKTSGAGHAFHLMFNSDQVVITGETKGYQRMSEGGNQVTTYFCPECGSPTHGITSGYPDMITLRAAILDESDGLSPQATVFKKHLRGWDNVAEGVPAFDAMA
ncbi:MAG: GFA family protein [Geminicoccaceae bacterium]